MAGHDTCSICLEKLIPVDGTTTEPKPIGAATCGHCFHCDCFWRWEEAKRQQDWRNRVASRGCPCPVCNAPVEEFIRLYIDADTKDIKKLKKELKLAKCKLAREKVRLEKTRQKLVAIAEDEIKDERSRRLMESSRRALERDIEELAATASQILNGDGPPSRSQPVQDEVDNSRDRRRNSRSRQSSYRKHDSQPVSPPPIRSGRSEQDPPTITCGRISMPPPPRSCSQYTTSTPCIRRCEDDGGSPRRRGLDAPSRMRPEDAPSSRTVRFRNYHHQPPSPDRRDQYHHHTTSASSSSRRNQRDGRVSAVGRPDPPRTPRHDDYHAQPFDDSFFELGNPQGSPPVSSRRLVIPNSYAPQPVVIVEDDSRSMPSILVVDEDDPSSSCRPRHHQHRILDSERESRVRPSLSPTSMFSRPLLNFLGVGLDSTPGLLGGCIHLDY